MVQLSLIIMGQNIGTCVTALLSSIGASKNAKAYSICPFVFQYYRFSDDFYDMVFMRWNAFVHFSFHSTIWPIRQVLRSSTVCLIFLATAILLPFHRGLEKLAILTVRTSDEEEKQSVQPAEEGTGYAASAG